MLVLTLGGVLFSGYLSFYKLLTGNCALNEPCPFFLGHPACWYGFAMFVAMFLIALSARIRNRAFRRPVMFTAAISLLGIIFSGSFVWSDVQVWLASAQSYALILPSCVYGLIFYIVIFALSLVALKNIREV